MHEVAWNALSRYVVCSLLTALVLEIAALRLTWKSARPLVGMVRGIEHTFVPPLLLCVSFFVLILENMFIGALWLVHAAAPGVGNVSGRPVYSAIYAEWLINVPILLVLAGTCALGRPLSDVSRPLVVTNLYIILARALGPQRAIPPGYRRRWCRVSPRSNIDRRAISWSMFGQVLCMPPWGPLPVSGLSVGCCSCYVDSGALPWRPCGKLWSVLGV